MVTQVQFRRGNTAQTSAFTGSNGEITVDTDKKTLVIHDGTNAGGSALQTASGLSSNVATLTANNTSFVGSVSAANVVSNAQLSSNLSNYQTTAGLSANIAAYLPTYSGISNAASHTTGAGYGSATGGVVVNTNIIAIGNTTANVTITANTMSIYGSNVGYMEVPQNSQSTAYTTVLSDSGKHILHPSSDNNARTFTIANNSSVAYPLGTILTFVNMANVITIAINNDTMYLSSNGATGSRTVNTYGTASALKVDSTTWLISGSNIT